jgi:hypothetical protein
LLGNYTKFDAILICHNMVAFNKCSNQQGRSVSITRQYIQFKLMYTVN